MLKTAEPAPARPAKTEDRELEFEIGRDSIMTVRISCGARGTVTADVLPERSNEPLKRQEGDSAMGPGPEGANA